MTATRTPDHPIHPVFVNRWSPRAFSGDPIDEATLRGLFEAARWAPSAYNSQPWRFVYARNGTGHWPALFDLLSEYNRSWAGTASALVLLVSKTRFVPPGKTEAIPAVSHSFDAGAAWAHLALQATVAGWATHAIGGFDKEKARHSLGIPADYHVEAIIAIGRRGDPAVLPESLREKEVPNARRPVGELIAEGRFRFEH